MLLQASAGKENEGMTETASLPIGLFDSGVGGLTVLKALQERLPCENYRFLGDTARLPYGTKGRDTIIRYTLNAAHRLVSVGAVKMLVIACNTATSCALPSLRKVFPDIPVLGVVEPGARAAVRATRTGYIAVLATEATIKGGAYQEAIFRLRPDARVVGRACPLFVPLAEEGLVEGEIAEAVERLYVSGLFEGSDRPDTVVLGCTHYPLLRKSLARVIGRGVSLVDSAEVTAESVEEYLTGKNLKNPSGVPGETHFMATDNAQRFARTGGIFLGRELSEGDVELVDIPSSISACSAR